MLHPDFIAWLISWKINYVVWDEKERQHGNTNLCKVAEHGKMNPTWEAKHGKMNQIREARHRKMNQIREAKHGKMNQIREAKHGKMNQIREAKMLIFHWPYGSSLCIRCHWHNDQDSLPSGQGWNSSIYRCSATSWHQTFPRSEAYRRLDKPRSLAVGGRLSASC